MPYELDITLNEPNDAVKLELRQGDSPLLRLTVFDYDGTAWANGYTATLKIGRANREPNIWEIGGIEGNGDNDWYFNLEVITSTIGDYDAILYLISPADATPVIPEIILDSTPLEEQYTAELDYTFLPIPLEVR